VTVELLGVPVEPALEVPAMAGPVIKRTLPGAHASLAAVRDRAIVRVQGVGTFEVAGGTRIRYAPENGGGIEAAAPWLNSTVATLLLAQRGEFALHASVVEIGGAGIAVCGERGAGKSTTALRLTQRGYRLVTDDVSVLRPGDRVMVHPLAHPVRVLPESAERLGLDTSSARRIAQQPKLTLPSPFGPPLPLRAIVVLEHGEEGELVTEPLRGAQACWAVVSNTHRGGLYRALWEADMFAWAGTVTADVPVERVERPRDRWTIDEVADAVERIASAVR
jgi:HPr Serine kinase C-terminal domain